MHKDTTMHKRQNDPQATKEPTATSKTQRINVYHNKFKLLFPKHHSYQPHLFITMNIKILSALLLVTGSQHHASAQESPPSCLGLSIGGAYFGDVVGGPTCEDSCYLFLGGENCIADGVIGCGHWFYESETINESKGSSCACGKAKTVLCEDEAAIVEGPAPEDSSITAFAFEVKSCSEEGINSGEECQTACTVAGGTGAYSSNFTGGVWECTCGDLGKYCEDTITPDFVTEPKSCTDDGISTFAECSSMCGADGSSWSTSTSADGVTKSCCVCEACGVFCKDVDETCISTAGTCTEPLTGDGGGGGGGVGEVPVGGDGSAESCAAQQISSFAECSSTCMAAGSSGSSWSSSWSSANSIKLTCCVCTSCGVFCTDSDPSCVSSAGVCQDEAAPTDPPASAFSEPSTVAPTNPVAAEATPTTKPSVRTDESSSEDDPSSRGASIATGWCFFVMLMMQIVNAA